MPAYTIPEPDGIRTADRKKRSPSFSSQTSSVLFSQELMQERSIYRTTVAESFQIKLSGIQFICWSIF
jgi:hypothetical protein